MELPKDNSIRNQHRKNDEYEAEYQAGANVEPTAPEELSIQLFDLRVQSRCSVKPHRFFPFAPSLASTARRRFPPFPREAEAAFGREVNWAASEIYSGYVLDFPREKNFLKPVIRTKSIPQAAAASGAFFSPVSTECTGLDESVGHFLVFIASDVRRPRNYAGPNRLTQKAKTGIQPTYLRQVVEFWIEWAAKARGSAAPASSLR